MRRRISFLLAAILVAAASPLQGEQLYGDATCARIVRVYDGDTFYCDIAGWPEIVGSGIGVRLAGVDTPEMRGRSDREKALARQAKVFVQDWLHSCRVVQLRNLRRGKYFRIVADVRCGDRDLATALIQAGLAKEYDGGTKAAW